MRDEYNAEEEFEYQGSVDRADLQRQYNALWSARMESEMSLLLRRMHEMRDMTDAEWRAWENGVMTQIARRLEEERELILMSNGEEVRVRKPEKSKGQEVPHAK